MLTKAKKIEAILSGLAIRNERVFRVALQRWMGFAQKQIQRDLTEKYIKKDVTSELTDWDFIESQGEKILKPTTLKIMQTAGNAAYRQLAISGSFDILNLHAIKAADKFGAKLVKDVTANTKKGVRTFVREGIKAGKGMDKIARELRPLVGLTGRQTESIINYRKLLEEKHPELSAAQVDKRVRTYTNKTHRRRMENIARTETARAQNIGYAQGLEEVGVVEAQFQISPTDYCEECAGLNGTRYPVAEAGGIIPVHPRCRCAMLPVVGEETITETLSAPPPELPGVFASPEGKMSWPKYRTAHQGEKSSTGLLYDYYKLQYETTGKMAEGTKKFLRAKAAKYEATSLKISKPIPGLEDIIKPVKVPPGSKPTVPTVIEPKPAVPKGLTQKEWEASITGPEELAFDFFTGDYHGYIDIRNYQLGKAVGVKVKRIGKLFDDALARAPKYEGTVYRGTGLRGHPDINVYKKGGTVNFDTSTSTSKLKSVADEFMHFADDAEMIPVRFSVKTKTGIDISKISVYDDQVEVVLAKGSKFKIIKEPEWVADASYRSKGYYRVHLEELVAKPKPPGLLPKSYFNEVDKWDERLVKHKASLRERIGVDLTDVKAYSKEWDELVPKFETALKSYTKPVTKIDIGREKFVNTGVKQAKLQNNVNKYFDVLEEIGVDDVLKNYNRAGIEANVVSGSHRASANPLSFNVNFGAKDTIGVHFHEFGHLLERNFSVKRKGYQWVSQRGKGIKIKMGDIQVWGSDPRSSAFKNKFIDPYVGKVYDNGSSEALSMGMQQFTSYGQMMKFAKKDFDHFAFVHGILTGAI